MTKQFGRVPCFILLLMTVSCLSACGAFSTETVREAAAPTASGNFPEDIPLLDGAEQVDIPNDFKVNGNHRSKVITYRVKTKMSNVERLYKEYMRIKGYTEEINHSGDNAMTLSGSLNKTTLAIAASVDGTNRAMIHVKIIWTGTNPA